MFSNGGIDVVRLVEGGKPFVYKRRRPDSSTLYEVVRDNIETLYEATEQGFSSPLPAFVRREFDRYLECGLLCRGFAMLACEDCDERRLVAFSCKGRAWCPSCFGRRMAQTSANLLDHVLPRVPLRQFVLTVPFELRTRLAYDGALLGAVCRIFVDSLLGFYRRRMRDLGVGAGKSGAVTVVQRTNADLRLNPHLHTVALDGVFVPADDGSLVFQELPELDAMDVADLLQVVRVRVLTMLERRGVIEQGDELTVVPSDLHEREPALAQLAAASVSGLAPAGPERRDRPYRAITLRAPPGIRMTAPLTATECGFSLHAATTADANDALGRQALLEYVLRPPIPNKRLELLGDDLVRIKLRRPFGDGTVAVDLDPLSLLCRLAAAVPPPRFNTIRYAGVLGSASKWRPLVVPEARRDKQPTEGSASKARPVVAAKPDGAADEHAPPPSQPATHRSGWRPWAELMRRTFSIDVEKCDRCSGTMKLRALVTDPQSARRITAHLGEPTTLPKRTAARDPPFFKTRVHRRRFEPAPSQQPMFAT